MPEVFEYPERVEIDFLPFVEQKIHQYGFHISGIKYFNHVLVPFINAEGRNGQKQKFRVHYDPRDMSKVYFYHPELKQYFGITYRFPSHPRMSKWELDEVRKTLNKQGRENVNEREIVRLIKERREIEVESAKSTRRARRNTERVRAADSLPKLVAVPAVPMRATRELLDAPRIRRPYATEDL
jgi:putative transposase